MLIEQRSTTQWSLAFIGRKWHQQQRRQRWAKFRPDWNVLLVPATRTWWSSAGNVNIASLLMMRFK